MLTEREAVIKALEESLEHWNENIKDLTEDPSLGEDREWVEANCTGDACALCNLTYDYGAASCRFQDIKCPLDDARGSGGCSNEWQRFYNEESTVENAIAMRDRIQRELTKMKGE